MTEALRGEMAAIPNFALISTELIRAAAIVSHALHETVTAGVLTKTASCLAVAWLWPSDRPR